MGRIYVSDAIKPALRMITDAYVKGLVSEDDIYRMAHGMAYHKEDNEKEEEKFPHTPLREEEKEKEEKVCVYKKNPKKSFFSTPSLQEITEYYKLKGYYTYTPEFFYNTYSSTNWLDANNNKVTDWQAKMERWEERNLRKIQRKNDDTRKKVHGTDTTAGYREDEDWRALGEWLDANYPVSAETIAAADEALKRPEFTLKWWGYRIGTTATIRIVIKKLYRLGEALNTSKKGLKPEKLERIANEILWQGDEKTLHELDIFFTKCKHGQFGTFPKGLQMTDLMSALGKYLRP